MKHVSRHALRLLLAGLLGLTALPVEAKAAPPIIALVPLPVRLVLTSGVFILGPKTVITVTPAAEVLTTGTLLAERLRAATGYPLPVISTRAGDPSRPDAIVLTTAGADAALGKEGYELTATPSGVVIRAPQPAGLFYGTQTLRELLPPEIESGTPTLRTAWQTPGVHIWDRPRFPVRGLMLDSARHLQSVSFIERTIDRMAYQKLNTFHWHLSDDQGWRIEIKRLPKLTQVGAWRDEGGHRYGGFYTQAQIREIVAYAAARFVTIMPEIDMPAHARAALASYPEIGCASGSSRVMCPAKPATYAFVEGVLTEVMDLFPSQAIHVGGDECPKEEWRASPECQALMRQEGLKDETALQNYFTRRIAAFLAAHGRRLQGWNEIQQGGPLPTDVIVQQWDDPHAAAAAAQAGNDVVASLTSFVYLDYSSDVTPLQRVYAYDPMPGGLSAAEARHILGPEACLWTETKPTDASADEYLWPRLTALAEVAWSPPAARDWPGFRARLLGGHYERLARMGLGASGADAWPVVRQALIERSAFDWGVRVGGWEPAQMSEQWKTLDWDITPQITGPGTYHLRLNYEAGAHALSASSVELLQNGKSVAQDTHTGWAGANAHDQVYRLALAAYDRAAQYAVRVRLRSDGGTDSHGALWLSGP